MRHFRNVRPKALQTVVEVRQVDERERRAVVRLDVLGGLCYPATAFDTAVGTPKVKQRKLTEFADERGAQVVRPSVDVGELATVGGVHGALDHRVVRRRVGRVAPVQVGDRKARIALTRYVPESRPLNQPV